MRFTIIWAIITAFRGTWEFDSSIKIVAVTENTHYTTAGQKFCDEFTSIWQDVLHNGKIVVYETGSFNDWWLLE